MRSCLLGVWVSREYLLCYTGLCPFISPRFLASSKRAAQFPRKHFVRRRWRRLVRQVRIRHRSVDVLSSGLCYPHSVVFYTKRTHRKKIACCGQVCSLIRSTHLFSALELTSLCSRVLSHDVRSSTILLWNDCHIVLADISLCLPTRGSVSWLRELGSTITLFGYLEQNQVTFYTFSVDPLYRDS